MATETIRNCEVCSTAFVVSYKTKKGVTCSDPCRAILAGRTRTTRLIARMRSLVTDIGEVPLTNGGVALVDPEDFDRVMEHVWHAEHRKGRTYVSSNIDGKTERLHRFVMNAPDGIEVDHENNDGLDNRRSTNLRFATHAENNTNRRALSPSGYRGVHEHKPGRWVAQLKKGGKMHYLGYFTDPSEAARVYDEKAREMFGAFGRFNFPKEGEQQA